MTPSFDTVADAFARGVEPDPNLPVDEWSDRFMIIPKESGANEYGKYRTSRTPHAREVMRCLSDDHPAKRVVVKGASQMLKTQVGLNFLGCSIHQSPSNFLWITPTGKLAKRASARISKTIAAVPELAERVAAPRSRDSVNTLDTKEYIGGTLYVVTAGAAANLSEVSARRLVYDEVDRSERNVQGEGSGPALAEARQTTFERNRKAYYPSSPTIEGESTIDDLYKQGTQREALAECPHCSHAQPLEFERLTVTADGQTAIYPCIECGAMMYETDKTRMFSRGLWSDGIAGDGETESFTISAMFLPYGWLPWIALYREYQTAKKEMDEGSEEKMIAFYNTRLARCWSRTKEQTRYDQLMARAESYQLGQVPAGGLFLTASGDTQNGRLEFKVVAWGEGMECWIVDYQVIHGSPDEEATWARADEVLRTRYRHAWGQMMTIEGALIDSGGGFTQDVYNYTRTRQRTGIYASKGASKPNRPIISTKPTLVEVNHRGKVEKNGAKLWFVGTDTAKDYLASRWKRDHGPGAVHFPANLPESYYKGLTSEYRTYTYKRGRKVSVWEKKQGDANEPLDLMVYNLATAHLLGLHRKTEGFWRDRREKLNPPIKDMLTQLEDQDRLQQSAPPPATAPVAKPEKVVSGLISVSGLRRGKA